MRRSKRYIVRAACVCVMYIGTFTLVMGKEQDNNAKSQNHNFILTITW